MTRGRTNALTGVFTAVVAAAVLAGCGGHPSSAGSGGSPSRDGSAAPAPVAYAACMRSHGVVTFPDPGADGRLPKVSPQQLGVSSTAYATAQGACAHLLRPSTSQQQQTRTGMLLFARCMRSHGVPDWPDPTFDVDGQPVFDLHRRVNPDVPPASTTADVCSRLLRPPAGQDGVVLCNGIGEGGCHHYGRPEG